MNKYTKRPKLEPVLQQGKFERFNLRENPFPSAPFVNPESTDARTNGDIYEDSIRQSEFAWIKENFLEVPQSDPNHLRLGYIMDTSYVGRGNGKSAFLINLQKQINRDFCLTLSNELNKCFALTLVPEPSGKTKTFENFVDILMSYIFQSTILDDALASLRLDAILSLEKDFSIEANFTGENDLREKLNSLDWYSQTRRDFRQVNQQVLSNSFLQNLPPDFPLYYSNGPLFPKITTQSSFMEYYQMLKRGRPKIEFVFSHLVNLFLAAGFTGAYIFVDDFERIPDFQTQRQRRDFALELRTCLYDGLYTNARIGFYNFFFVIHPGVVSLIQEAWGQSGIEQRASIFSKGTPKHIIRFEKIRLEHAYALVQKYLHEYRIDPTSSDDLSPFTKKAVAKIAELSEFNAAKILQMAYEVLERAVSQNIEQIDASFVPSSDEILTLEQEKTGGIHDALTKDLLQEAGQVG
jgi:hypothetical protein